MVWRKREGRWYSIVLSLGARAGASRDWIMLEVKIDTGTESLVLWMK